MKIKKWAYKVYLEVMAKRDLWLDRPARFLISQGISANMISLFRMAMIVPLFVAIGWAPLWAVIILILNYFILDAIDGVVARKSGKAGIKGRVLDVCIDNFYVVPLVLALIYFNVCESFWGALFIFVISANYFLNFVKFGIEAGKYPFNFYKYLVYLALIFWVFLNINIFDYVLVFLGLYLAISDVEISISLFHDKRING